MLKIYLYDNLFELVYKCTTINIGMFREYFYILKCWNSFNTYETISFSFFKKIENGRWRAYTSTDLVEFSNHNRYCRYIVEVDIKAKDKQLIWTCHWEKIVCIFHKKYSNEYLIFFSTTFYFNLVPILSKLIIIWVKNNLQISKTRTVSIYVYAKKHNFFENERWRAYTSTDLVRVFKS